MPFPEQIFKKLYKGDNQLKILDQRYLPRWIIIVIDSIIGVISMAFTYLILSETPIKFHDIISIPLQGISIFCTTILFFFVFKTYAGIIRHSTFTDLLKLVFSSFSTAATIIAFNVLYSTFTGQGKIFLTTSVLIYVLILFSTMLLFRIAIKESYRFLKNIAKSSFRKRVVIIGVDDHTISIGKLLTTDSNESFQLVGFISKESKPTRIKILGKPVFKIDTNFYNTISTIDIDGIFLVEGTISGKEKSQILEDCLKNNIEVFNVPHYEKWNKKEDIRNQIKPIEIEDLLERTPISIESDIIDRDLKNKTVLVTGGAGSIGSEIVRQLVNFETELVVVLDQTESVLHELEIYLQSNYPKFKFITELADISNMYRMGLMFEKYDFDIVYHAAAYKHVPLIERNPHEAVYVNILGTVNLSVLSVNHKIEKFVMISTDKAVNPTNVMGASKRAAEMYVQSLQNQKDCDTRFITTRFGNVLGSSGSVIPHFRKQISQGGPVTVTHKDIIRYFMTISEACQLVLQAGAMGKGGEIYAFDMGKPVKIMSLAEKMIRLSGYQPYVDIDIKITGLRPGEKLFEELLHDSATTMPTHHPKIMITIMPQVDFEKFNKQIKQLIHVATMRKNEKVVKLLKDLVPEFISENSEFELLDKPKKAKMIKIK